MPKASERQRAPAKSAQPRTKAALVRAVAHDLQGFSVSELRSFKQLVERKRLQGKQGSVITAYVPDVAVGTTVAFKLNDGSTVIARTSAPRSGQFVVVEPKRHVVIMRIQSKPAVKSFVLKDTKGPLDRAREQYRSLRDTVVEQSLSLTKAARRMNLTTEGLSARVARSEMLAFVEHNRKMVPIELIDDDQPDHTVRGLSEVIKAAQIEPFRLAVWLLYPARSLGDRRPIDELRAGKVERVVRAVRGVDAS
jgi:hypothetical protein